MNKFAIIENDFNNIENHNPLSEAVIGYIECESVEEADHFCLEKGFTAVKTYRGWDGMIYPHYTYKKIEKLN